MIYLVAGIDIETTGLKQEDGHRIIEVGLAVYKTSDFYNFEKVGKTMCQRINPLRNIDKKAQAVHGISLEELKYEPEWEEFAPKLAKILAKCHLIVAHNVEFDLPFVAFELERINLPIPKCDYYCTMLNGREATPLGSIPSLGNLCWAFDVDYDEDEAHAADYDIDVTMECFIKGVQNGTFKPFNLAQNKAA